MPAALLVTEHGSLSIARLRLTLLDWVPRRIVGTSRAGAIGPLPQLGERVLLDLSELRVERRLFGLPGATEGRQRTSECEALLRRVVALPAVPHCVQLVANFFAEQSCKASNASPINLLSSFSLACG